MCRVWRLRSVLRESRHGGTAALAAGEAAAHGSASAACTRLQRAIIRRDDL